MPARLLRAILFAALSLGAVPVVHAADLGGDEYPPYGTPREHRDYSEYNEPYPAPPPPRADYDRADRYADGCVPRWKVRRNLEEDGWVDVQPLDRVGGLVTLRARREDSGRVFLLRVDRCSGEVVRARPDMLRSFGDGPRPGWGRPDWSRSAWRDDRGPY